MPQRTLLPWLVSSPLSFLWISTDCASSFRAHPPAPGVWSLYASLCPGWFNCSNASVPFSEKPSPCASLEEPRRNPGEAAVGMFGRLHFSEVSTHLPMPVAALLRGPLGASPPPPPPICAGCPQLRLSGPTHGLGHLQGWAPTALGSSAGATPLWVNSFLT